MWQMSLDRREPGDPKRRQRVYNATVETYPECNAKERRVERDNKEFPSSSGCFLSLSTTEKREDPKPTKSSD